MAQKFSIRPYRMINGGQGFPTIYMLEGASETFEKGDVLIVGGSGRVDEAGTEPVDNIVGIAAEDASGTTDNPVLVWPAIPGMTFYGLIGTSTSAGDSATTDILAEYPLGLSSSDWFVDKTDNNNPCVRVLSLIDDAGTTNGAVEFVFMSNMTAWYD